MTHTTEKLEAMLAAANARADQARDAALVEAAGTLEVQALDTDAQAKRFRGGSDPWADRTARSRALRNSAAAILALRDKPAPAVTVQEAAMVLLDLLKTPLEKAPIEASHIEDVWIATFRKSGFAAVKGFLRAIAGGGDE